MKRRLNFVLYCLVMFLLVLSSCNKEETSSADIDNGITHEEESDYTWDSSSEIDIILNGTSIEKSSSKVTVSGTTATITSAGNYRISGSLTSGQIVVNAGDEDLVRLILDGASVINATSSALVVLNSSKTIINLVSGTTNTLTDATTYTSFIDEDLNAALFSKSDLTIFGEGTLVVNGNYNDGITSKDGLILKSGTYNVTAKDDGIRGKDFLIVESGSYTVNSGGDGLKSDNEDASAVGYIKITGGDFSITSSGDGISAQTNVMVGGDGTYTLKTGGGSSSTATSTSSKGIKGLTKVTVESGTYVINSADDGIHSNNAVEINGGNIQISTADDGVHAESSITVNDGIVAVTKSYEAFESLKITVNGGSVNLVATNDAVNATAGTVNGGTEQTDGSCLAVTGGTLCASCTNGDAIDSNGNVLITGGTVVVNGPASGIEEAADVNGSFNMNGGFFIGAGTNSNMNKTMSATSSQHNIYVISSRSSLSAGTIFHIQDGTGADIVTFKPVRSYYSILFSSSSLATSVTYSIYTGGTCTGTESNGLYSGGTYSGGTFKKSFTLSTSSAVTSISL